MKKKREWLEIASEELDSSRILFENKKYPQSIFFLQQSSEKISKEALRILGILSMGETDSEKVQRCMNTFGITKYTAIDYGHAWHKKMLTVMENFVNQLEVLTEVITNMKFDDKNITSSTNDFKKSIPRFRDAIKTLNGLEAKSNPSLKELKDVIGISNHILDSSFEIDSKLLKTQKQTKLPDKETLKKMIEKKLDVKLNEESIEIIDKIYAVPPTKYFDKKTILSSVIMVLAVLNTYLLPHESSSRYPSSKVVYDDKLALVLVFDDMTNLIEICLKLLKKYY